MIESTFSQLHIFTPASHKDVLALISMMAVLLITARTFGEIMLRLGQPAVIGEIGAGILLGPSCLGYFFPASIGYVAPETATQGHLLESIGLIGAMFLLLITGIETDLTLIKRHAKTVLGISFGGIAVTFLCGFLLGHFIPEQLLPPESRRAVFCLFLATAMSISAIPVVAKILMDLKMIRSDIGQTILAVGMSDDTWGWILLSIAAGLASENNASMMNIIKPIGSVTLFLIFSFTFGRWAIKKSLDFVQDNIKSPFRILTLIVTFVFAWGAMTQYLHLEPVLGAFVIGILFGQLPRLPQKTLEQLESITLGIFSPIFFAIAGLKINLISLHQANLWNIALIVTLVATVAKVIGTYIGARVIGKQDPWRSLSYGAALNSRGAMGIIVATIGLSIGILSQEMFSIIVLMAIVTSMISPFALRWTLSHINPSNEEKLRLEKEKQAKSSTIQNIHRILVPLRKPHNSEEINFIQLIKSRLLQQIAIHTKISITLLNADNPKYKDDNMGYLHQMSELFNKNEVRTKFIPTKKPAEQILDEANKDYDLVVLGASESENDRRYLFSSLIDSVVKLCPCPTMIVNARNISANWEPNKILIPTNGSNASKNAAELSFILCSAEKQKVFALNVIEESPRLVLYSDDDPHLKNQLAIAERMVDDIEVMGKLHQVEVIKQVKIADSAIEAIVQIAQKQKIDLIVLGTEIRPGSGRLFLGPNVERILQKAPCPVVILNTI